MISAQSRPCTRVSFQDKTFIKKELKVLHRRKQREYVKKGKSLKYDKLKDEFDRKYKAAIEMYIRNRVDDLKEVQPGRAYNIFETMGAQPGDCIDDPSVSLPDHLRKNLSDEQFAERLSEIFAAMSGEYTPLSESLLPDKVKFRLNDGTNPPTKSEYDVYLKLNLKQ